MVSHQAARTDSRLAARCAAVASFGAAVIHVAVAPMHWTDWAPSGLFFASIAAFQLLWGLLAWSWPNSLVLVAGIAANVVSAALWGISRTAGAPFGPHAGVPEAVDAAGISVLLLQCYVVMGATWALYRRCRAEEVPSVGRSLVLLGATTVMAGAVTVGLASGLQGHHHHVGVGVEVEAGHSPESAVKPDAVAVPPSPAAPAPAFSPVPEAGGHQHDHDH